MPIRPIDPNKRGLRPVLPALKPGSPARIVLRSRSAAAAADAETLPAPASPADSAGISSVGPGKRAHHKVDRTSDNWDENGDYIVGKGRPPKHSRWQRGQSGNPAGPKPKEVVDPQTLLDQYILADFSARKNGEDVTLNLGMLAVDGIKANAAKGVTKAQTLALEIYVAAIRRQAAAAGDTPEVQAWEQQVMDALLQKLDLPAVPVMRAERDRGGNAGDSV